MIPCENHGPTPSQAVQQRWRQLIGAAWGCRGGAGERDDDKGYARVTSRSHEIDQGSSTQPTTQSDLFLHQWSLEGRFCASLTRMGKCVRSPSHVEKR